MPGHWIHHLTLVLYQEQHRWICFSFLCTHFGSIIVSDWIYHCFVFGNSFTQVIIGTWEWLISRVNLGEVYFLKKL